MNAAGSNFLKVEEVEAVYNGVILALKGVSLAVPKGGIVALLGANGAGKTTTLKAISNLLRAERGEVTAGSIEFDGRRVERSEPQALVRSGLVQVMEGRHCFRQLSVEENLLAGAHTRRLSKVELHENLERVYQHFPRLKTKRRLRAGYCSGGEQQMCAIGRALMADPRMVLLDEPSMGLAPQVMEEIFGIVRALNAHEGVSFLIAEQNAMLALSCADYGYILENGAVRLHGEAQALRDNPEVKEFYLGMGSGDRWSFRDTQKHYRKRDRWLSDEVMTEG